MIDDEPHVFETLTHYATLNDVAVLGKYTDPRMGLEAVANIRPDILFCDIEMSGMTGMEIAGAIPASTLLVFVSAHDKYAVEGYAKHAVDFLRKPVKKEAFHTSIGLCRERLYELRSWGQDPTSDEGSFLLKEVPGRRSWMRVWYKQIIHITVDDNILSFSIAGKEKPVRTYGNFTNLTDFINHHGFVQVHRSRVVNKQWIDRIVYDEVYLKGMAKGMKIGNSFRRALIEALGPLSKRKP